MKSIGKRILAISAALGICLLTVFLTGQIDKSGDLYLTDAEHDLLVRWNRTAAYDSISYFLQPRIALWSKENPAAIGLVIKYYVNWIYQENPQSVGDTLDKYENLIRHTHGEALTLQFIYLQRALFWLNTGQYDEAKQLAQHIARHADLKQTFPILAADASNLASFISLQYGEIEQALKFNDAADSIFIAEKGQDYFGRISTLNNYGILFEMLGRHQDALDIGIQMVQIIEQHYSEGHENHIKTLNSLGLKHAALGNYDEAIRIYKETIDWNEKLQKNTNLFDVYMNMAAAYIGKYDYAKAEELLNHAEKILEAEETPYVGFELEILLRRASYAVDLRDSAHVSQRMDALVDYALLHFEENDYRLSKVYALLNVYFRETRDFKQAIQYVEKYLSIFSGWGEESDSYAHGLNWKASTLHALGELDSALVYHNKALKMYEDILGNTHPYFFEVQNDIASIYLDLADWDKAAEILNSILWTNNKVVHKPIQLPDYDIIYKHTQLLKTLELLLQLAPNLREDQIYGSDKGIMIAEIYDYIAFEFDRLYRDYGGYKSRDDLREKSAIIFKEAIAHCYILYQKENDPKWVDKAILFAGRTRGLKVQEILSNKLATWESGIPETTRAEEVMLLTQKNNIEERLKEATKEDTLLLHSLRKEFAINSRKYEKFVSSLEQSYPKYYDIKYSVQIAGYKEISTALLNKKRALLQYTVFPDQIIAKVITRQSRKMMAIPIPLNFKHLVNNYYFSMKNRAFMDTEALSRDIAATLFHPLLPYLESYDEIIIVPDEWIYYINFEALPAPEVDTYLIERFNFTYAYSPTIAIQSLKYQKIKTKRDFDWVGFVPGFAKNDAANALESQFTYQPYASKLADSIAPFFRSRLFKAERANIKTFKDSAAIGAVLHIGTHAIANDQQPMESYLVLSDSKGTYEKLKAAEIFNKEINVSCTVLTACETALGKIRGGEGMVSLARAFTYAGSPNLVVTLWSVDDQQTAKIIQYFYKNIAHGERYDVSLRKAKLDFLKEARGELRQPFYWAGLMYWGNDAHLDRPSNILWWALGLFLILSIAGLFTYKQKGRNT